MPVLAIECAFFGANILLWSHILILSGFDILIDLARRFSASNASKFHG
jgi:hypothetical protein